MRNEKMKGKKMMFLLLLLLLQFSAKAQIGYQVSLLNTATGEPQANVSVNATATITNSINEVIWTGTKPAISNEFGVISLTVGDKDTFKNVDTSKLPFFIEVQVNGAVIGKSQILTVPVAEIAGTLKSSFTKEDLVGTWSGYRPIFMYYFVFKSDNSCSEIKSPDGDESGEVITTEGTYYIEGDNIYVLNDYGLCHLRWRNGNLYGANGVLYTKQ